MSTICSDVSGFVRRSFANDQDFGGKLVAQPARWPSADTDQQRSVPRTRINKQAGSWRQPQVFHFAERSRISVRDTADHRGDTAGPFRKGHFFTNRNHAIFFRNDVPMRINVRVAKFGRDPVLQAFRDVMLKAFRLVMNLIPGKIEHIM